MEREIWKDVKGYEDEYKISSYGKLVSKERQVPGKNGSIRTIFEKEISATDNGKGYLKVALYKDGKRKLITIHKLVAENFIEKTRSDFTEVNHKDGNKLNNFYKNLEWVTTKENCMHRQETGLLKNNSKKILPKRVAQIDIKTGKIINEFDSVWEAKKFMKSPKADISRCALGKQKTCLGYKWKYLD